MRNGPTEGAPEPADSPRVTRPQGADDSKNATRGQSADVVRALVDNHRAFLSFLEGRLGGHRELAEDILQEAFVRGIDRVKTLRNDESALAWFYRTLRNATIDQRRRQGAADRALAAFALELETHEGPPDDVRGSVCQCVARIATTLKPEYAEALQRIEVQGLPVKAFAAEQGISSSNAAVRVFRAREALRRQVVASCGSCAEQGCLNCTCQAPAPTAPADECPEA